MRNLITLISMLLLTMFSFSQIKFFNLYTDNGVDVGQGVVQLEDSSYVLTGSSSSFSGSSEVFLMKVDSLGEYMWSNHYGGAESESGRRVLYKKNVGFYICGFSNSFGNGDFDNYMVKVDESGAFEWEKTYGGAGWEKVHDAAMTRDTGVIMVGETSSNPTDNQDVYIVRTDMMGDTMWTKTIGGLGDDYATCIHQYNDSTFVVGGTTFIEDSLYTKGLLIYLHDDGTIYWQDTIGFNGDYKLNDFVFDGAEIVGTGSVKNENTNEEDTFFFIEYMFGEYQGEFFIPEEGNSENLAMITYGPMNNYYVASNFENSFSYNNGYDIGINRYNQGSIGWMGGFGIGFDNPDDIGQFIRTNDGGAIIVGATTGNYSGGNEIFLAKIGPNDDYPNPEMDVVINNVVEVEEIASNQFLMISPNPSSSKFNIQMNNPKFTHVALVDMFGKKVLESDFQLEVVIDVESFEKGVYFIELSGDNIQRIRSTVVVH